MTNNELQNRLRVLKDAPLSQIVVRKLMEVLTQNPYAQFLRTLEHAPLETCQIHITDIKLDQRVYNSQSADQLAAI